jgi:hypothetical protein
MILLLIGGRFAGHRPPSEAVCSLAPKQAPEGAAVRVLGVLPVASIRLVPLPCLLCLQAPHEGLTTCQCNVLASVVKMSYAVSNSVAWGEIQAFDRLVPPGHPPGSTSLLTRASTSGCHNGQTTLYKTTHKITSTDMGTSLFGEMIISHRTESGAWKRKATADNAELPRRQASRKSMQAYDTETICT